MDLYSYRLKTPTFKSKDWYLAFSKEEIDVEVSRMNSEPNNAEEWSAEVHQIRLTDGFKRELAGKLMGSIATSTKKITSRENGKKGGRPKGAKDSKPRTRKTQS